MIINKNRLIGRGIIIILITSSLFLIGTFQSTITTITGASGSYDEDFLTTTYMDGANTNVTGWGDGSLSNIKKKPTIIGSISSSLIGNALDIFIADHIAYVTDNLGSMKVINISDPTNPFILGTYTTPDIAASVFVEDQIAYIAAYEGDSPQYQNFFVVDVSNPKSPTHLGNCSTVSAAGDIARDVVVRNTTAFVANSGGGLCIIDLTDPANPSQIGSRDTAGTTTNLAIVEDYALLADGSNGLVIVDVTDPMYPSIVTTYSAGISSAINVVVQGDLAYVADFDNGVIIVDITDITAPTYVGSWSKSSVSDAAIYGDYLYVIDIVDGLSVVNVTDPFSPVFLNEITISGLLHSIVIEGIDAYIACQTGGLQVVRIADMIDPIFMGSHPSVGCRDVIIDEDIAYVADNNNDSLQILNVSNPYSPYQIGFFTFIDGPNNLFLVGDLLYVAIAVVSVGRLQILNISDPTKPTSEGYADTGGYAMGVYVEGDYAYVAAGNNGLEIYDVSNPTSPSHVATHNTYNTSCYAYDIEVKDNYAYVTDLALDLVIFDVSTPSSPSVTDFFYSGSGNSYEIALYGYYACIAHRFEGLQILNISDPTDVSLVSYYDTGEGTANQSLGIHADAGYAYVAAWTGGLIILDIGNPKHPTFVSHYDTPENTYDIDIHGDIAYLADFDGGLQIIEFRRTRERQFDSPCYAQSDIVHTASSSIITSATLTAVDNIPSSTTISYELSANGGSNWETITPGIEHIFSVPGYQLKWRAVLSTTDSSATPTISNISIYYTTLLDTPSLINPINNAITEDYTPTFTWSNVNGETNYLFQLDTTTSFATPLLNVTLPSSVNSYTPGSPLAVDTYYWRVAGIDSDGDIGMFSSYRTLYVIQDNNVPTIDSPSDVPYTLGQTGNTITWNPSDSNPDWYNVTLNAGLYDEDVWDGSSITIDLDGFAQGTYTFVCYVYDLDGNSASDSVDVIVSTDPPIIDDIADFPYEEGSTGNSITWHPSDGNPDYFTVTRNGVVIDDGPWGGGDIYIDIDGLEYGIYAYVCTVNDTDGQEASDTVVVTVTDSVTPVLNSPADVSYSMGATGNSITWTATDNNPGTYEILENGIIIDTDTWVSGLPIVISVDGLPVGTYTYTIIVSDEAGNFASDEVIVIVTAAVQEFIMLPGLFVVATILLATLCFIRRKLRFFEK